jgi:cytosine/adenosine deaminase-related metal-dependent hydrolase
VCNSGNAPLSIHFKESEGEEQLFSGYGALAEWYSQVGFECDFLHYNSAAQRIVKSIPASRSVMLVHNCFVTQQDIELIMNHFSAPVYWVLCPRSNRYISGSITDAVHLLRKNHLNICIGTDSLASNTSLSIIEELKCFKDIPLEELLRWATTNGAAALGIEPKGLINISGADLSTMRITEDTTVKRVL